MEKKNKPNIRLVFSRESFNTFFEMLTFYAASEVQAGETFYSYTAVRMMNQFVKYGIFTEKADEKDDLFIISLFEKEAVKILRMYNKYISIHQSPSKDFFAEFKEKRKLLPQ